ncbi:MAG TPA: minor capsid protein [Nitrospiraceae bacterium]
MPVLDELGTYLEAQGVGILGVSLFQGGIPQDAPNIAIQDSLLALIEVPGLPPVHVHTQTAATYEQPMVQVATRGQPYGYDGARAMAQQAFLALDGLANVVLSGVEYLWIQAMQSPFLLRTDELARPLLVFTVRVAKALT